jgi:hypothetical protein
VVRRPPPVLSAPRRRRPGPASLALGVPLLALAYFLGAPYLPALQAGDTTILVAGCVGLLMIAATTLSLLGARDSVTGLLLIALGCGLIAGALNAEGAAGVGAGANVVEAMFAAAIGLLFAQLLRAPPIAIAVPFFVAAIDVWSVFSGPTEELLAGGTPSADPLSFDLPAWGHAGSAGHLGVSDAIFLAMFAAWAFHHELRRTATLAGLSLGLLASLALGIALDEAIPALPLIAAGYVLPNLDRLVRLLMRHAS